ncbi:MAG: 16S rRNA (cytidine(1402)-2'-O)-methyltransferase [Mycoplasmataceae bacterium]|nr:16S rRNA (cytidine(1402)-2'-O)-methyltransferase [Mycoplasmataceae bacterium]
MTGKLYIVGTPIGNLKDITLRAIETLKIVDYIACEDTRTTKVLLNYLDIRGKKLISYHNFNELPSTKGIIELLKNNNSVALVSDAGMPIIADPGFNLLKEIKEIGFDFEVIPGVSALTTSIAISGFNSNFTFLGFPKNKKEAMTNQIKNINSGTYVFFIAPHKLLFTLEILDQVFKGTEKIFIAKELTKKFEEHFYGTASELISRMPATIKGEFTLIFSIEKIKKEKINKYKLI